ncbi:hypothetical protein TGRUB_306700 [Toxoplasma gondii RUB]|uniref:Uncharacterized protein n=1 Tax=Toxoplasma gondii RUB TaxID=935652 RepID=A0A086LJ63_TOXGO|nr:hypothetical protein TGRUB_306700 [Toxoplasma gondii RUB]
MLGTDSGKIVSLTGRLMWGHILPGTDKHSSCVAHVSFVILGGWQPCEATRTGGTVQWAYVTGPARFTGIKWLHKAMLSLLCTIEQTEELVGSVCLDGKRVSMCFSAVELGDGETVLDTGHQRSNGERTRHHMLATLLKTCSAARLGAAVRPGSGAVGCNPVPPVLLSLRRSSVSAETSGTEQQVTGRRPSPVEHSIMKLDTEGTLS